MALTLPTVVCVVDRVVNVLTFFTGDTTTV